MRCDTVSAFAGRGKLNGLKILRKDLSFQEKFSQLGKSWNLTDDLFQKMEQFTCCMYIANCSTCEVNEPRHRLFCAKRTVSSPAGFHHADSVFTCMLTTGKPSGCNLDLLSTSFSCGAKSYSAWSDGEQAIHWTRSPPAPDVLLELLSCCKCVHANYRILLLRLTNA